ncbi:MAG TPA: Flp family type IVb pilin [Gaiellaceae bacterium]
MTNFRRRTYRRLRSQRGQTMAEYSVLVAVIALVVMLVLPQMGTQLSAWFTAAAAAL